MAVIRIYNSVNMHDLNDRQRICAYHIVCSMPKHMAQRWRAARLNAIAGFFVRTSTIQDKHFSFHIWYIYIFAVCCCWVLTCSMVAQTAQRRGWWSGLWDIQQIENNNYHRNMTSRKVEKKWKYSWNRWIYTVRTYCTGWFTYNTII